MTVSVAQVRRTKTKAERKAGGSAGEASEDGDTEQEAAGDLER